MKNPYEDIIHLPHHRSERHSPMSLLDRAAQFSPFAALTGYDATIEEAGRLTDHQVTLDVDAQAELDQRLNQIREQISLRPQVTVTFFEPDEWKAGGRYVTRTGRVRKIDGTDQRLTLNTGEEICFSDIVAVEQESCR